MTQLSSSFRVVAVNFNRRYWEVVGDSVHVLCGKKRLNKKRHVEVLHKIGGWGGITGFSIKCCHEFRARFSMEFYREFGTCVVVGFFFLWNSVMIWFYMKFCCEFSTRFYMKFCCEISWLANALNSHLNCQQTHLYT